MSSGVFLDSSGLFAFLVARDVSHELANDVVHNVVKEGGRLFTTDYVLDETATLLKARGYGHVIANLFDGIASSKACRMEWMDQESFASTKAFFLRHHDHAWSFTDCFSFVTMKKAGLTKALTKDAHFAEAGFESLL